MGILLYQSSFYSFVETLFLYQQAGSDGRYVEIKHASENPLSENYPLIIL